MPIDRSKIRSNLCAVRQDVADSLPKTRENSLALTKLDEELHWFDAGQPIEEFSGEASS